MKKPEIDEFTQKIKYLKCRSFFPDYCAIRYTSNTMRKLAGRNANGNPSCFSAEQKQKIIAGIEKFLEEIRTISQNQK
ncbi:MAG: hypothetical protein LBP85_03940 [Prevotellaceae bacterium]|jgi:hypothetical protein|nr:hypothetical protein [Prevotellaceae bacterium]